MRQAATAGAKKLPITIKDIFLHKNGDALSSELVLILKEKVVGKVSSWFTDVATGRRTVKIVQNASESGKDHTFFTEVYDTSRKEKKNNAIETKVIDIYALLRAQYTELSFKLRDLDMFLVENNGRTKHYEIPVRVKFSHKDTNPAFLEYYIVPMDTTVSRASNTTKNANHLHSYTVDSAGNGYTSYAYSPDNPKIKHRHVIKNGIVQDAQSDCYPNCEDMYGVPGVGPHIHNVTPNIERHVVIQNGSVLGSGVVYTTGAGRIWAGDVYHRPNTKEAFADKKMRKPLTMVHVTNTKVKDFRKAELADSIIMNVSPDEVENKYKTRRSYFSEAYVSRTLEDECSIMFTVDYQALLESKATMRDFKDPDSGVSFGVDVKKIKVLRKRLKTNSRTTESRASGYDEEVILEFKVTPGAAITSTSPKVLIEEIEGLSFSTPGMKTFRVVDREMSEMKDGIYQYGIEFVYVDDSIDKLLNVRKLIDSNIDKLKVFLYESRNQINIETNRFSDKYVDAYANNEDLSKAIGDYVSALRLFKNSPGFASTARFLMASTSVHTGSPEGILSFGNNMKRLSSKINKIVIEKTTGLKGMINPNTKDVNISNRSHKESSVRYYFDNSYNASAPKNVGYDFLSHDRAPNKKPETRRITPQSLMDRARKETKKYFKAGIRNDDAFSSLFPDQDDAEMPTRGGVTDGEVTYFTPSFVMYGDNSIFDNLNRDLSKPPGVEYNNFIVDMVDRKFNNFSQPSFGMPTHQKINGIVSNRNIVLLSRDVDVKGEPVGSCGGLTESLRLFKIIRRDSSTERNFDSFEEEKANLEDTPENKNLFLFSVLATENFNVLGASIGRFDATTTKATKASILRLPNQLKSLVYSNANSSVVRSPRIIEKSQPLKDVDNFGFVYMNYKNIVSVEYLDTLPVDSDGNTLPRGGTWRKLTADKLASTNSGKLLCRLKRPGLDEFNIRTANILDLPIYNEYFVVDTEKRKLLSRNNDASDNRLIVKKMYERNVINKSVVPCDVIHLRGR